MPTVTELAYTTTAAVDQLAADWVQDDEDDEKTSRRTLATSRVSARASTTQTAGTGGTGNGVLANQSAPNSSGTAAPSSSKRNKGKEAFADVMIVILPIVFVALLPYIMLHLQKSQKGLAYHMKSVAPSQLPQSWKGLLLTTMENVAYGLVNLFTLGIMGRQWYDPTLDEPRQEATNVVLDKAREFFSKDENKLLLQIDSDNGHLLHSTEVVHSRFQTFMDGNTSGGDAAAGTE